jgi:hypothetical protein
VGSGTTLTNEQQSIAHAQLEHADSTSTRVQWVMPLSVIFLVVPAIADSGGLRVLWATIAAFELLATIASVLMIRRQKRRLEKALAN